MSKICDLAWTDSSKRKSRGSCITHLEVPECCCTKLRLQPQSRDYHLCELQYEYTYMHGWGMQVQTERRHSLNISCFQLFEIEVHTQFWLWSRNPVHVYARHLYIHTQVPHNHSWAVPKYQQFFLCIYITMIGSHSISAEIRDTFSWVIEYCEILYGIFCFLNMHD